MIRELAIKSVDKVIKSGGFFQKSQENFANMIVLTSLRNMQYINKVIEQFAKKPKQTKPILICAVAEMLYLDTPDYAVINSYVEITKRSFSKQIASFVNAVLRNISRSKEEIIANDDDAFFPPSFLETLKGYDEKIIKQMEHDAKIEPLTNIVYKNGEQTFIDKKVEEIAGYEEGDFWVQDVASAMPVTMLGNIKGLRVLDLCAAPGGKSAQLLANGAVVTCVDMSQRRLETLKENMQRLKLEPKEVICQDAFDYLKQYNDEPFDIVLLDAPCSATGTLRRHPEVVLLKTSKDVDAMAKTQLSLLNLCKKAIKQGGILMYCNCSLAKKEGEDLIKTFLKTASYKELEQKRLLANIDQDGFFISKLEKL